MGMTLILPKYTVLELGAFGMDNYFETPGVNPETPTQAIGFPGTVGSDGGGNVVKWRERVWRSSLFVRRKS